jgi:hypothetical protein
MFGLNKGCLTTSFNYVIFIKDPLIFIIHFISSSNFFNSNRILLDTSKKNSNFHIFQFCVYQELRFLKSS